jgi:sn-glycerol 3-phosphate transport system permease protein
MGINQMIAPGEDQTNWPVVMATAILAMIPPVFVVVAMQRLFVKGLVETEK